MEDFIVNADVYYKEAFNRNIGLLTEEEQKRLRDYKIGIVGMGGVGGFHLLTLLRLGIGEFHIADMDTYETANLQRQCGAYLDTLGQNKAEVMKKVALSINPHLYIKSFPEGVSKNNIDEFLSEVDILVDGIDFFSIEERRLIFSEAKKRGIFAITAGPLGFGSALLIFSPKGMSFDEYFDLNDKMTYMEKIIAFGVGLAPAGIHLEYFNLNSVDVSNKHGPSLVTACSLCSVLVATEVINILLKKKTQAIVPYYFQFDPYMRKAKQGYLRWGNRNPVQKLKRWYLKKKLSKK